jgi:hypothetical protein
MNYKNIFYLPFLYLISTRLAKPGRLFSYVFLLIILPVCFALINYPFISLRYILNLLIGLLIIHNFYEIGYIQNDTETIKFELNPTLRLSQKSLKYYYNNKFKIYFLRIMIFLMLVVLLLSTNFSVISTLLFTSISLLIPIIFIIYNFIRNKLNLILHLILNVLKFTSIQFIVLDYFDEFTFAISILAYPLINFIDRSAHPRFSKRISNIYNRPKFRFLYYLFISFILSILTFVFNTNIVFLFIFYILLIYRMLLFFLIEKQIIE